MNGRHAHSPTFAAHKAAMALLAGLWLSLSSCTATAPSPAKPTAEGRTMIELPEPRLDGPFSLEELLSRRRSVRTFSDETLSLEDISQLLWAAQGITDPRGFRTAPSAGALYPLEIYYVSAEGIFHYIPASHVLERMREGDRRAALSEAALNQAALLEAPATLVITAVFARTEAKYGSDRGPRYVFLEAGHAAQNVLLQAVALDLAGVPIGAFDDAAIQIAVGLTQDQSPIYLIPVGHPR